MNKIIAIAAIAAGVLAFSGTASADQPSCNWGEVTSAAIAGGFDQGEHASSFAGSPRVGLANVVSRGDLNSLCEFLS